MAPNTEPEPETALFKRKSADKVVDDRDWQPHDITMKEIRDAVPAHCFKRETLRSFAY
ncbi:hypothetical protein BC937DRAFT_94705, partial [Endogone sp. FLAS-F59071]